MKRSHDLASLIDIEYNHGLTKVRIASLYLITVIRDYLHVNEIKKHSYVVVKWSLRVKKRTSLTVMSSITLG